MSLSFGLKAEQRRRACLALRVAGFSQKGIGRALRVHQTTVSRDLAYWRADGARELRREAIAAGWTPRDAGVMIGEALAFYDDIRVLALRRHDLLTLDPATAGAEGLHAQIACLQVAILAAHSAIRLLREVGLLGHYPWPHSTVASADEIRARLVAVGALGAPSEAAMQSAVSASPKR